MQHEIVLTTCELLYPERSETEADASVWWTVCFNCWWHNCSLYFTLWSVITEWQLESSCSAKQRDWGYTMAAGGDSQHYVELCKNPIRFEPVSKANNVFFDDANKQVQHVLRLTVRMSFSTDGHSSSVHIKTILWLKVLLKGHMSFTIWSHLRFFSVVFRWWTIFIWLTL